MLFSCGFCAVAPHRNARLENLKLESSADNDNDSFVELLVFAVLAALVALVVASLVLVLVVLTLVLVGITLLAGDSILVDGQSSSL